MGKRAATFMALFFLAGCQSSTMPGKQDASGETGKGDAGAQRVTSLEGYTGTWQVDSFAGSTQIDVKRVGNRYLGYADRYINGQTVGVVETRIQDGRIKMDWDVDGNVELAPDITTTCDVVETGQVLNCTGWPLQGRKRWHKVSDDYLVEARTGKSVANLVSGGGRAAEGSTARGSSANSVDSRRATEIAGLVRGSSCGYRAGANASSIYAKAAGALREVQPAMPATLSQRIAAANMSDFSCSLGKRVIDDRLRVADGSIETFRQSSVSGAPLRIECKQAFDPSIVGAAECELAGAVADLVYTAELCRRKCQ